MTQRRFLLLLFGALMMTWPTRSNAQAGAPPTTPRAAAPIDLAGYWVSLVTNEWRWRMVTPPKGDYATLPINADARRVADTWDAARDEADGNQCRGYGAAVIMQVPARFHIFWENDNTLQMDIDAGMQTRRFHFGTAARSGAEPSWQGFSVAEWQMARGQAREAQAAQPLAGRSGTLKVVTAGLRSGYLRKNGVPYSDKTVVTEHFSRFSGPGGEYLNVMVTVEDPQYLTGPYVRTMQFRREADGSKWKPEACSAR